MKAPNIIITGAGLSYADKIIFNDLNVTFAAGKWTALLGTSGIGKSSLLRMMADLTVSNEKTWGLLQTDNDVPLSQQIAYMGQTDLLLPWLTVLSNVLLGFKLRQQSRHIYQTQMTKAKLLLIDVGLGEVIYSYPHQLSGGMRQRVALVRTLMENKPIVLMDEPFSAVDTLTRYKLQELAAHLLKDRTVLFITHDPTEALRLAHTIYLMQDRPAILQLAATLTSAVPRSLTDSELLSHQADFFQQLTKAVNEGACK